LFSNDNFGLILAESNITVTLYWLRHSYATHLLEGRTDLRYIQEILGHKSSKTTEIYTYVSTKQIQKIKSPIDDFNCWDK
jgi:integrase/recombinase XerD